MCCEGVSERAKREGERDMFGKREREVGKRGEAETGAETETDTHTHTYIHTHTRRQR